MRNLRWCSAILVLGPFVACALVYLPTLSGALLSDDYAVLAALSDWSQEGHLLRALVSKFYSGLDSPSFYYRPLSMASFGSNFALTGADPFAWRLINLALHLASGALVFAIARRFSIESGDRSNTGPSIAAAVFLLFPTSPEAVAWVSGRYDLLALLFMLATLAFFQRAARWYDPCRVACQRAARIGGRVAPLSPFAGLVGSRLRPGERHGAAHRLLLLSESSLCIAKLSLPLSAAQGDWLGAWQHALAANPCAEVAAELTEL